MLGYFWTSIFRSGGIDPSSDDAYLATSSTFEFWFWGTCMKATWSNSWAKCFVNLWYLCIPSSFALYSPFIYLITNLESLWRSRFLAPNAFPILSPVSMASYSASLLVAGYWSCTPYLSAFPSRVMMITLAPPFFQNDEPSVRIVHLSELSWTSSSLGTVNSTTKFTNACALTAVLGWYLMSN